MTGMAIFTACPADDAAIQAARDFIKKRGLTAADVRMVKRGDVVQVIERSRRDGL
jgi:hypothetical protein